MKIKIVQRPVGEAPEWVRDAWLGLSLPLAVDRRATWRGLGVLSGPHHPLGQLWAVATGKVAKITGYAVEAKAAVDILSLARRDAAAWWREHTPKLLGRKRCFVFDAAACEPELQ